MGYEGVSRFVEVLPPPNFPNYNYAIFLARARAGRCYQLRGKFDKVSHLDTL
jgi:hypothetical protein